MADGNPSWLTSAAPLIGAGLDFVSGLGSSLFNLNQARKNRAFQERMYNKQVEDNLRMWNINNDYNLPKNVLARMKDAGLNPLLMYEGGASMLTSNNVASGGNAPSGDSARAMMQSNFAGAATQSALMQAQIRNIDADTAKKEQEADESWTHTDWYRSTKGIQYSILKRNDHMLRYNITEIATRTNALASMTWKNLEVMDKGIEYLEKNYKLSERDLENRIAYNLATIALGQQEVNAKLKEIGVKMYDAVTKRMVSVKEIEKMDAEIKKILADKNLSELDQKAKVNEIVSGKLRNILLSHYGTDDLAGSVGALLLLSTSIGGDFDVDIKELNEMYKEYGLTFK